MGQSFLLQVRVSQHDRGSVRFYFLKCSGSFSEMISFLFYFVFILGKRFEEGREEMGMRVFLSLNLSELSPWLLKGCGGDSFTYISGDTENKRVTLIFFEAGPCEGL